MIPRKYLHGLDANDLDIAGIFGVRHSRAPNSWRIICSYEDGQRHKATLFAKMAAMGQSEARRTWDLHHVVEGQHYADVDFSGQLRALYKGQLPCVLIAKEEHVAYNRLLHVSDTDELYRDRELPSNVGQRSAAAMAAARDRSKHASLRNRVEDLLRLYRNAYSGDTVLVTIAENVLNDARSLLR